jgi:predicted DNA-binding WGR domain protein
MKPDYFWIGHCYEDTHDKVWGIINLGSVEYTVTTPAWVGAYERRRLNNFVTFWGRRGKKLQTKIYQETTAWEMEKLYEKKEAKGYQEIDFAKLDEVYPNFEKDLEKMTFWAQFKV